MPTSRTVRPVQIPVNRVFTALIPDLNRFATARGHGTANADPTEMPLALLNIS